MTGWIMKELRLKKHRTHSGCKQLNLNRFLMLPTDVLYGVRLFVPCSDSSLPFVQIFEWLHPVDLYHLMQSTRTFRGVILNQTYRGVWKSAFRLYDDLPTCPEDVSEPQWSSLLFGPDTCDVSSLLRLEFWVGDPAHINYCVNRSVGTMGPSLTLPFGNGYVVFAQLVSRGLWLFVLDLFFD